MYEQRPEINYRFNDITFWYPLLKRIGMRVPRTLIVHTEANLSKLLDGEKPDGLDYFTESLIKAIQKIGLPCFLRSGQTSNKHAWNKSCYIEKYDRIGSHVINIVEMSEMVNTPELPLPYDFWAVRELIPTKPLFHAFSGNMPITKERRYFINKGKIQCSHPYWPSDAFEDQRDHTWEWHIDELQEISSGEKEELDSMALFIAKHFPDYWSVDFLQAADGDWWVTDMAMGADSWHWSTCRYWRDDE